MNQKEIDKKKIKNIEEANRHREEIEMAHAKRLRAERNSSK